MRMGGYKQSGWATSGAGRVWRLTFIPNLPS
jgi:hypothetical protein